MLLPLKTVIVKKPRKDGNFLIYFQYCYSPTHRVLLSSEIAVPKSCWNKKRQCISKSLPIEIGNDEYLNSEITRMFKVIERLIELGRSENAPNMGAYVKDRFSPKVQIEDVAQAPVSSYTTY